MLFRHILIISSLNDISKGLLIERKNNRFNMEKIKLLAKFISNACYFMFTWTLNVMLCWTSQVIII